MDRLSRIFPEQLGGDAAIHQLLREVPEEVSLDDIRRSGELPDCEAQYARLFGHLPEGERPVRFRLRGPLCFALAESERARRFPELITGGRWEEAGRLMTLGHAGDRVSGKMQVASERDPVYLHPGAYGASTPALDAIVDEALSLGALGACLTGAGMGGSALALCRRDSLEGVAAGLRAFLGTSRYAALAGCSAPLPVDVAAQSVCVNHSVAGAGLIDLPL
jgi:galactokinase